MRAQSSQLDELKNHFVLNKVRGKSYIHTSFSLLGFFYQRYFRGIRAPLNSGDVIDGYQLYTRPLLMSYSRSGTNSVRYVVEFLSQQPTPGYQRTLGGANYFIDRAHAGYRHLENYSKTILVIRNYKECLVRHHGLGFVKSFASIADYLETQDRLQRPAWYIKNIQAFEKFSGDKLLLYYEDILTAPEREYRRLAAFLELENKRLPDLINNIDEHKKRSVALYQTDHESVTAGRADMLDYHSKQGLSAEERQAFDDYYRENYPSLFKTYLSRYQE